jgi:hypothetical protein
MRNYRLYYLDPHGHVARAEDIETSDDLSALDAAKGRRGEHPIEIWQEARRVACLTQDGETFIPSAR